MMSAQAFRNTYIGKAIDVDGVSGPQCVDLFKQCCILAGRGNFSLGGSGLALEISKRFDSLNLAPYFNRVNIASIQYGDWIIWDRGSETPFSHVAMFVRRDGNKRMIVLGQNQFGKRYGNEGSLTTNGILTVLRLKAWAPSQSIIPTIDMIARQVIQGLWGNGSDRIARLRLAGYDPKVIQNAVNALLR